MTLKIEDNTSLKKRLLGGASALAMVAVMGAGSAWATELDDGVTIVAGAAALAGYDESDGDNADTQGATVDSTAAAVVLGAVGGADSISINDTTDESDVTLAVTTSGTANGVTFAGDIDISSDADNTLIINATNDDMTFQGSITDAANNVVDINIGSGGANPTLTATFDNSSAGTETVEATIDAVDTSDTVNLVINNTDGTTSNTYTFVNAIGSSVAIDSVTIGANADVTFSAALDVEGGTITNNSNDDHTFSSTVDVSTFTHAGTGTLDFDGAVDDAGAAMDLNVSNGGTVDLAAVLTGDIDNTGTAGTGTINLSAHTGDVTGTIGASAAFATLQATTAGGSKLFVTGDTTANNIIVGGSGVFDVGGDIVASADNGVRFTGASTLEVAATKNITGNVTTSSDGQGTLTFETQTDSISLVTGNVGVATTGALSALNVVSGATFTSTFDGNVAADTVTITGTGTVAVAGNLTAATAVNLGADATLTVIANDGIEGALDNTSGGDDIGTVTFAATTTDTTLVAGATGGTNDLKAVNVAPASGVTATFTGAYDALATKHSGAGTVAFGSTVDGAVNISNGGSVTFAGAVSGTGTGTVDNTSGADGSGTATFAATIGATGAIGATNSLAAVVADSTGGTSAFGGAISATSITLGGTGTTTLAGNVTGAVKISADGTVTVAADKKIVGSVTNTSGTTAKGTLNFSTSTTATDLVSGNIGASDATLLAVEAVAGAGVVSTFKGDIWASTVNLDGSDGTGTVDLEGDVNGAITIDTNDTIVTLSGTAAQTITGSITAADDDDGIISVTNTAGTVTFSGALGANGGNNLTSATLATDSTTVFGSTVDVETLTLATDSEVTFNGAVNTGTNLVLNNSTINIGTGFANGASIITAATAVADTTGKTIAVNMPVDITDGQSLIILDGGFANGDLGTYTGTANALFTYATTSDGSVAGDNNDVVITATARTAAGVSTFAGTNTNDSNALIQARTVAVLTGANADATGLAAFNTAVQGGAATSKTFAQKVGVQADALAGANTAIVSTGNKVNSITSSRLASLRNAEQTGFATGDMAAKNSAWVKPFGSKVEQDDKDGISGYDADSYGVAFGLDTEVQEGVRIGGAFAYASTEVDGNGAGNSNQDIDSYQFSIYGDYTTPKYYVEAIAGYGSNGIEGSRVDSASRTLRSDYDAQQYMVSVGAGMPQKLENNTFVTPTAGLAWTHLASDTYTETGTGNFRSTVNSDDTDAVVASLGATVHKVIKQNNGTLTPELRLGIEYDFVGDEASASSTFNGGTTSYKTTGIENEQFGGNVGVGVSFDSGEWTLRADYDANIKADYVGHSASLKAGIKF